MPVKTDASGKRWVEMGFVVPGSPEEVWAAIATGAGNSAWFTQATIDERVGGAITFDFGGGMTSSGTVTLWEPPHRFSYEERDWSGEAPPIATEIVITGRAGGTCVVRMVHALFTSSDAWDDEMEGFEAGWPGFIEVLRVYLAHFAGQPAAPVRAMSPCADDQAGAWKRLGEALGLAGANVGEQRSAGPEAPALAGTVEIVRQDARTREIMLRVSEPGPGIALIGVHPYAGSTHASLSLFLYGDGAPALAARLEPHWHDWLAKTMAGEAG
ncbi:SRPBCC family protein [Marinivivus vitaminiproducens]|uniref:SRPBCC family protein n=1 Tax=Marinivivus vitaminiproducens TaxID=3035935 RepID=UPI00279D6709|nr:SRPBCC domain-containing protein [Geminicoccaceae bacterium SCSIO 64248]